MRAQIPHPSKYRPSHNDNFDKQEFKVGDVVVVADESFSFYYTKAGKRYSSYEIERGKIRKCSDIKNGPQWIVTDVNATNLETDDHGSNLWGPNTVCLMAANGDILHTHPRRIRLIKASSTTPAKPEKAHKMKKDDFTFEPGDFVEVTDNSWAVEKVGDSYRRFSDYGTWVVVEVDVDCPDNGGGYSDGYHGKPNSVHISNKEGRHVFINPGKSGNSSPFIKHTEPPYDAHLYPVPGTRSQYLIVDAKKTVERVHQRKFNPYDKVRITDWYRVIQVGGGRRVEEKTFDDHRHNCDTRFEVLSVDCPGLPSRHGGNNNDTIVADEDGVQFYCRAADCAK